MAHCCSEPSHNWAHSSSHWSDQKWPLIHWSPPSTPLCSPHFFLFSTGPRGQSAALCSLSLNQWLLGGKQERTHSVLVRCIGQVSVPLKGEVGWRMEEVRKKRRRVGSQRESESVCLHSCFTPHMEQLVFLFAGQWSCSGCHRSLWLDVCEEFLCVALHVRHKATLSHFCLFISNEAFCPGLFPVLFLTAASWWWGR